MPFNRLECANSVGVGQTHINNSKVSSFCNRNADQCSNLYTIDKDCQLNMTETSVI